MVLIARCTRILVPALTLGAALVTLQPGAAGAVPAQSSKVLPAMRVVASAVDTAGGSLVAGVAYSSSRKGLFLYRRGPSGHWSDGIRAPLGGQDPTRIRDVEATAGTDGFYLVSWLYAPAQGDASVWAATRLPSGRITGPVHLFDTTSTAPLRMAANRTGGAAVTQASGVNASEYVRAAGWRSLDTDTSHDPAGEGDRRDAVVTVSEAGNVDLTFALRSGDHDHVVQVTNVSGATATRRDIYTGPDTVETHFAIAMDGNGLQTLVADDSDDAIKVYREDVRRGPFVYRWRKPIGSMDSDVNRPQVASAGSYTRVAWHTGSPENPGVTRTTDAKARAAAGSSFTRAFNGTVWGPTVSFLDRYGSIGHVTGFGIGTDGRGVELGWQLLDHDFVVLTRGLLERTSRVDEDISTTLDPDTPATAMAVGRTSVSQVVWTEFRSDGHRRTVALVRR